MQLSLSYPSAETRLPCEFCEELYPEEDLILHQVGCLIIWGREGGGKLTQEEGLWEHHPLFNSAHCPLGQFEENALLLSLPRS